MSNAQAIDKTGAEAIPPLAPPSRMALRHRFVLFSFVLMVLMPVYTVGWYLWTRAADQYASHLGFSVRAEESGPAIELLGGVTSLSGSSSSDTDILFAYLTSQKLVRLMDERVDLRAIWADPTGGRDPVFAFDPAGTIEDLQAHWARKVRLVYDTGAGMIDLRILAFTSRDATRIARALEAACSAMINDLSAAAREDAIGYARAELNGAVARLKAARGALTAYRNRNQMVDPRMDTAGRMGLVTTLQQQLAEALIDLDLLRESTRASDPRVVQATRRVALIEQRIAAERQTLGLGAEGDTGSAFAALVGEYESLIVDREFAETAYTAALAAYDAAQAEAQRQSRYLAVHIEPTRAETAEYPERLRLLALSAVFAFLLWAIAVLIYYSLRDRR
ncbi:capsule biosynthesis protein [Roseovarius spongiae]|uniref:Capsule biosynthesis protein n=1 Tax=Roseovarius spongiae TaxID=2320272 RepID=A0A3A8ASV0_9RHOB|nr:capsule biosynthesis protein [Roseovarius spongiae]RKF13478.1 capsule biosynthesis protein [Roseovarius spongiae]